MGKIRHASTGIGIADDQEWQGESSHLIGDIANLNVVRTATYVVTANGAPAHVKAQADYVCDGTADDVEIQAAIDALTAGRTRKEKVLLIGSFTTAATLLIPSYTILGLDGKVTLANAANCHMLQNSDTVGGNTQIEVRGGVWDGNKTNQVGNYFWDYFMRVTDLTLNDLEVQNFISDGIHIRINSHRFIVKNIRTHDNGENGLFITQSNYGRISEVISYSNTAGNGIMIGHSADSPATKISVTNVVAYSNGHNGLLVQNAEDVLVVGEFYGNTYSGVSVSSSSKNVRLFVKANENNQNGVTIAGCAGFSVIGETKNNNQGAQADWTLKCGTIVYAAAAASNYGIISVDASDTQAVPTQYIGIYIEVDATKIVIIGNVVFNNTYAQIVNDAGAETLVRNNKGYVTESSGTTTITAAATTVVVTHGLAATPTRVFVSPTLLSSVTKWWVTTLTSTQFTINVDQVPGVGTATFDWHAQVGEG